MRTKTPRLEDQSLLIAKRASPASERCRVAIGVYRFSVTDARLLALGFKLISTTKDSSWRGDTYTQIWRRQRA